VTEKERGKSRGYVGKLGRFETSSHQEVTRIRLRVKKDGSKRKGGLKGDVLSGSQ